MHELYTLNKLRGTAFPRHMNWSVLSKISHNDQWSYDKTTTFVTKLLGVKYKQNCPGRAKITRKTNGRGVLWNFRPENGDIYMWVDSFMTWN